MVELVKKEVKASFRIYEAVHRRCISRYNVMCKYNLYVKSTSDYRILEFVTVIILDLLMLFSLQSYDTYHYS